MEKPVILVAPLNWGLGHATRCIPLVKALQTNNFRPIIASDGVALALLKKEFPDVTFLELPSYQIEYAKKASMFKWKMIKNSPKMLDAMLKERKLIKKWIHEFDLAGIISDNRLGVYSKKVPSDFFDSSNQCFDWKNKLGNQQNASIYHQKIHRMLGARFGKKP